MSGDDAAAGETTPDEVRARSGRSAGGADRSDGGAPAGVGERAPDGEAMDGEPFDEATFDWDDDGIDADRDAGVGATQRRLARRMLAAIGVLIVLVTGVSVLAGVFHHQQPGVVYRYVIPHGTGERLAAGEPLDVLPRTIEMRTQDTLVIDNQDHEAFSVGGLRVAPEQTMTYRFSRPGNYGGTCELHEGGSVDIVVV